MKNPQILCTGLVICTQRLCTVSVILTSDLVCKHPSQTGPVIAKRLWTGPVNSKCLWTGPVISVHLLLLKTENQKLAFEKHDSYCFTQYIPQRFNIFYPEIGKN